jgi:hypothetical protein
VVCRYRKEEKWNEPTYAMCLPEFEELHDGEWMGNADEIGSTNGSQLLAGLGA